MSVKFGDRVIQARKENELSREELAEKVGTSGPIIGRYERIENMSSIGAAVKIADAFEVSLDYLVGEGINSKFDKKTVKRLQDIEKLEAKNKEHVFAMLDAFIRQTKLQGMLN